MPILDTEVREVQNAAFGAVILAGFVRGYYEVDPRREGAPLPYLYVALPMLLHSEFYRLISTTRLGLRGMAEKFVSSEHAGTDLLLSLNEKARVFRPLTSRSIGVLVATRLGRINAQSGRITPLRARALLSRPELPAQFPHAKKLGDWFAALTPFEIGSILKVTF